MESAVEDTLNKLTTGPEEQQRKYSEGLSLGNNMKNKGLKRKQTISALRQRNQTYRESKKPGAVSRFHRQNILGYIMICLIFWVYKSND